MTQHTSTSLLSPSEKSALGSAITDKPMSIAGFDINPFSLGTTAFDTVAKTTFSPVVSTLGALSNIRAENIASKAVNPNQNFFSTIAKATLPSAISGKSAIDTVRERADINKDKVVTKQEFDLYSRNFLDRNVPTAKVKKTELPQVYTKQNITMFNNPFERIKTPEPKVKTTNISPSLSNTPMGVGTTGDLGGATGAGYKGSTGGLFGFGKTEGVDPSSSSQTGAQTSVTGGVGGMSFADDAATSDTGDDSTYICTALYDMGDMKVYIYKYDQMYGRNVNPAIYRGYTVWGKFLADRIRNKGWIYKIVKPIALGWAYQMAYDLSKGKVGKNSKSIRAMKLVGEIVCWVLGQTIKRS